MSAAGGLADDEGGGEDGGVEGRIVSRLDLDVSGVARPDFVT